MHVPIKNTSFGILPDPIPLGREGEAPSPDPGAGIRRCRDVGLSGEQRARTQARAVGGPKGIAGSGGTQGTAAGHFVIRS